MNWHRADRCEVCGADEAESLLGAFRRYVGGIGHVATVECRDQRACWRRLDEQRRPATVEAHRAA